MATATPEPLPVLITGPEVARRLGVSLATWKRMKHHFTAVKIPGSNPRYSWAIVQDELRRFCRNAEGGA
jgi:hypothetical protein